MELAHWFYEDHYRERDESLPRFNIKEFITLGASGLPSPPLCTALIVAAVFNKCTLLRRYRDQVDEILLDWVQYKIKVPVFGLIILNPTLDKVRAWRLSPSISPQCWRC